MDRKIKQQARYKRHKRVRAKIIGTRKTPRLCVFRSNKHIYCQLINDDKGEVLVSASDQELKKPVTVKTKEKNSKTGKIDIAYRVGKLIAKKASKEKIKKVVFDRAGYQYHGRVKGLSEGARNGGLIF